MTFAIGEVAAMLGISAHTIRAWERRHRVVRPTRTVSGQRRYTAEDVEVLRQIKHERHVHALSMRVATLTAQGVLVPDSGVRSGPAAPVSGERADPLRMVADLVAEIVVVIDAHGRIAHANTTFVRFCGVLPGRLRGALFADFVDPFDRAKAVQVYQAPLRQRRGWELNLRTERRRAFFSFDCWPTSSEEGPMLVLVGRDLSSQAASPQASEAVSGGGEGPDAGGIALVSADADLTVLYADRAFRRLLAANQSPVEGRPWRTLVPGPDGRRVATEAEMAIRSGRPRRVASLRPGGNAVWDVDLSPVTGVGGAVTHVVLAIAAAGPNRLPSATREGVVQ